MVRHADAFVGGTPAFDLANTVNARPHPSRDDLDRYEGLVDWAVEANIVSPDQRGDLLRVEQQAANRALRDARRLRETIYRVYSAIASRTPAPARDVDELLAMHAGTLAHASLRPGRRGTFAARWPARDRILGPVAEAAVELLRHGPLEKVKECPSCGWLFLDRSRSGTRRWCSMDTCGTRDKMRRYRRQATR